MDARKPYARDAWAILFTHRLLELQPDLDIADAVSACRQIFAVAANMQPEMAAEVYSEGHPPRGLLQPPS